MIPGAYSFFIFLNTEGPTAYELPVENKLQNPNTTKTSAKFV